MRAYVPWGAEAVEHRIEVRLEVGPGHVLHRRRRRRNVMAGDEALRQVRGTRIASTARESPIVTCFFLYLVLVSMAYASAGTETYRSWDTW
jgi:hypothetical protein